MANPLAPLERATTQLAKATTVLEAIDIRDKADAAAHYCRAARLGQQNYNTAAEMKLRAERRAGELLADQVKQGRPEKDSHAECFSLESLGVSPKESHHWQAIAVVPEDEFEDYIATKRETQKDIRSGDMIREGQRIKREAKKAKQQPEESAATVAVGDWRIIQGDVLDGLGEIHASGDRARLVFTDPPYNIGIDYGKGAKADKLSDEGYMTWVGEWLEMCRECLTDDGSMWVMIGDEYAAEYGVLLKSLGLTVRSWIKWYETFGVNCNNKFNRTSRHIFYCVKDPKRFVFHREPVTRPSDRQTKYGDKRANSDGKLWDDVWEIPRLVGTSVERISGFPTQLPLRLVSPIVECASDPGDLVVDPFNGSGTTGVASVELGRRYIGIELSEEYATKAKARLGSAQLPIPEVIQ